MALQVDPQVQAFISEPHYGVLATAGDDGSLQQAVIWYALDSERQHGDTETRRLGG